MIARVLIVAGSDSGGGAGIQADIKTVTCLGGYAATAVTALTAQNTLGVHGIFRVDPAFIEQQMRVVLEDIGADCIKTGMLHSMEVVRVIAGVLHDYRNIPLVVDPVMVAQSGDRLLDNDARQVLIDLLLCKASLITPNLPEAEALTGISITDLDTQKQAARQFLSIGCTAVLVKGGHADGDMIHDVYASNAGIQVLSGSRIHTHNNHGTGCTLASAIATGIARGLDTVAAIAAARSYLRQALSTANDIGHGHGPLNHGHTISEEYRS